MIRKNVVLYLDKKKDLVSLVLVFFCYKRKNSNMMSLAGDVDVLARTGLCVKSPDVTLAKYVSAKPQIKLNVSLCPNLTFV